VDSYTFSERGSTEAVEEGRALAPKFDADGLVTCVATDATTGELLMVAHMNAEALAKTIESGEAWYFSRSRRRLWRKGESSGHVQRVLEMRVDCDQDAVWIKVEQAGPGACHTGRRSCFYRAVPLMRFEFQEGIGMAIRKEVLSALFLPAISKAVPWSGEVLTMGRPAV